MTRVLIVTASISRVTGVPEVARLLAGALQRRAGISVQVIAMNDTEEKLDLSAWKGIDVRTHRAYGPANFGFSPGLFLDVLRSDADIIHVHGVWMFYCLAVLVRSLLRPQPYVVSPHGMLKASIRRRSRPLKVAVSWLFHNFFLRRASLLLLSNEGERGDIDEMDLKSPIRYVPNFVDCPATDGGEPTWWQKGYAGRDIYLFFGRIHELKGCMELCRAWDEQCAADSAFRDRSQLVFCGWPSGLAEFEPTVADIAAQHGNIVYAGPQTGTERGRSFAAANFFVLPSKTEGLPMSVLESWTTGTPVLMTRACNISEGFELGAAIEIGQDADGIRRGLTAASAMSIDERAAMARAGEALVQGTYSEERVVEEALDAYREALGSTAAECATVIEVPEP